MYRNWSVEQGAMQHFYELVSGEKRMSTFGDIIAKREYQQTFGETCSGSFITAAAITMWSIHPQARWKIHYAEYSYMDGSFT